MSDSLETEVPVVEARFDANNWINVQIICFSYIYLTTARFMSLLRFILRFSVFLFSFLFLMYLHFFCNHRFEWRINVFYLSFKQIQNTFDFEKGFLYHETFVEYT